MVSDTRLRNLCFAIPLVLVLPSSPARGSAWVPGPAFPDQTQARSYATGVNVGGTLVAVGGTPLSSPGDGDGAVHSLAPGAGSWQALSFLDGPYIHQGAGIDGLGRIVVFGGARPDDGEGWGRARVYDLVKGFTDEVADPSNSAPAQLFAVATDNLGRIYAIGGGAGASGANSTYCERYDATLDAWQSIAPLPTALADAAAAYDGQGHIVLLGGFNPNGTNRSADVLRYDIAGNFWSSTALPDLPEGVTGLRAVRGADDRIYAIGGELGPIAAPTYSNHVWVLDLATNSWNAGPNLIDARAHFGAVLGDDDHIYALGGRGIGNGLWKVEKLFTPTCPQISPLAETTSTWIGATFQLAPSVTGGAPLTFQWRRNGSPLLDGPAPGGGTIAGASTSTLSISEIGIADQGLYDLAVSNDCGTVVSSATELVTLLPPTQNTVWTVTNLHPGGYTSSYATGISGERIVGTASAPHPTYGSLDHPIVWPIDGSGFVDATPPTSVGGGAQRISGEIVVGWWWWPYQCYVGGQWYTCYSRQACLWRGLSLAHENLQVSGWEYSTAVATDGTSHGGSITTDDGSGNSWSHAVRWSEPGGSYTDLHPPGASSSAVRGIDGSRQYGSIYTPYPAPVAHAAGWNGSWSSFVDLHPAGASSSGIADAQDGEQVGSATLGGQAHAGIWAGTAASFLDLHPAGAAYSTAVATHTHIQAGTVTTAGSSHAVLWAGGPENLVDLHLSLGSEYNSSSATDLEVMEDGSIHVVGLGYNTTTARNEALLWISEPLVSETPQVEVGSIVSRLTLDAFPNPALGPVSIAFSVAPGNAAKLGVFDVAGREIRSLQVGAGQADGGQITWDGRDNDHRPVPAGAYFIRLQSADREISRALRIVR